MPPTHLRTCSTQWGDIFCQSCSRCLQGCHGWASESILAPPYPVQISVHKKKKKATKYESRLTTQWPSWSGAGSCCVMFDLLARFSSSTSGGGGPCLRTESSAKEPQSKRRRQKWTLISFIPVLAVLLGGDRSPQRSYSSLLLLFTDSRQVRRTP